MSGIEDDIRGRYSEPYDNEPLATQVKRLADVIMAEFGEHEAWKGESLGACDLAIKIMSMDKKEVSRLRAENERQKELLQSVVTFADEAWAKWDADEDMRVGKMLVALAGGCPGYRPETDAIHAALKS